MSVEIADGVGYDDVRALACPGQTDAQKPRPSGVRLCLVAVELVGLEQQNSGVCFAALRPSG
jgi:hypothetical protein